MNMEHRERRRWCEEISRINRKMNEDGSERNNPFDVFRTPSRTFDAPFRKG